MHVGLNLVFLVPGEVGGVEIYARELIQQLVVAAPEHRYTAFVSHEAAAVEGPWNTLIESVLVPVRARNRLEWVRGEQQLLPPRAHRAGVDLLHSLANTAPVWGPYRRVTTIHDLIHRTVPEAHPGVRAHGMRLLVGLAARRTHRIIASSHNTAAELERLLHTPAGKVDVVPLGIGHVQRAQPLPEPELRARLDAGMRPIALSVSAKLPHKNLRRLVTALSLIPAQERPLLVLPGYRTPHETELQHLARQLEVDDVIRWLGWIPAAELEGLYAAAAMFVFPSLAEGFGLPILEAMSRGVPVACSDRGAIAEVAGDAALQFDPESPGDIAQAMTRLLRDDNLARRLSQAGRRRAGEFSWEATTAGTLASYARAIGEGPAGSRAPASARPA
ncbi:MAG TPA: glycosyltransferase family 1 protein [Solirubrobacteraceae bacterium]|jgi:glycosyltransferase involved in cell wall biosynthesis|nr:glycosyltransferase family 1 protein [Solirubrobacteraceae bacterium]